MMPIVQKPLYIDVSEQLREMIYQRKLMPGDWIDEMALCAQIGISRTPLREALKVLHAEGLIEIVPRRGSRVSVLDEDGLHELFPVMATLEGLCAYFAVKHQSEEELAELEQLHARLEELATAGKVDEYFEANHQFHKTVQKFAHNRWLSRITSELRNVLLLARHRQLKVPGRLQQSLEEHRMIIDAFRNGDAKAAQERMNDHLCQQEKSLAEKAPEFVSAMSRAKTG